VSGGGAAGFAGATAAGGNKTDLDRRLVAGGGSAGSTASGSTWEAFRNGEIERVTPFHRTRSSSLNRRLLMSSGRAWDRI
jgi:hypothetical protein